MQRICRRSVKCNGPTCNARLAHHSVTSTIINSTEVN